MFNVFSLLNNIMLSRALFASADMNIADHLKNNSLNLPQLAEKIKANPSTLQRLLYFLELHGVFTRDPLGNYHNTPFSQTMCTDHPNSIRPFLLHEDSTRWNSFGHLDYSIKTGKSSFEMLYGQNYFDYIKDHPQLSERFDEAMKVISQQEDQEIAKAIAFKGVIVDIGGGKGQLLDYIQKKYSCTQGILFELPEVIATITTQIFTKIAGSFFELPFIEADTFILKRILHDWDDEQALKILKNVSNSMDSKSDLYIIEGILDQAKNKQLLAAIDLGLLAIFQGKERTLQEISNLLNNANLALIKIIPINDIISVIQCKKI